MSSPLPGPSTWDPLSQPRIRHITSIRIHNLNVNLLPSSSSPEIPYPSIPGQLTAIHTIHDKFHNDPIIDDHTEGSSSNRNNADHLNVQNGGPPKQIKRSPSINAILNNPDPASSPPNNNISTSSPSFPSPPSDPSPHLYPHPSPPVPLRRRTNSSPRPHPTPVRQGSNDTILANPKRASFTGSSPGLGSGSSLVIGAGGSGAGNGAVRPGMHHGRSRSRLIVPRPGAGAGVEGSGSGVGGGGTLGLGISTGGYSNGGGLISPVSPTFPTHGGGGYYGVPSGSGSGTGTGQGQSTHLTPEEQYSSSPQPLPLSTSTSTPLVPTNSRSRARSSSISSLRSPNPLHPSHGHPSHGHGPGHGRRDRSNTITSNLSVDTSGHVILTDGEGHEKKEREREGLPQLGEAAEEEDDRASNDGNGVAIAVAEDTEGGEEDVELGMELRGLERKLVRCFVTMVLLDDLGRWKEIQDARGEGRLGTTEEVGVIKGYVLDDQPGSKSTKSNGTSTPRPAPGRRTPPAARNSSSSQRNGRAQSKSIPNQASSTSKSPRPATFSASRPSTPSKTPNQKHAKPVPRPPPASRNPSSISPPPKSSPNSRRTSVGGTSTPRNTTATNGKSSTTMSPPTSSSRRASATSPKPGGDDLRRTISRGSVGGGMVSPGSSRSSTPVGKGLKGGSPEPGVRRLGSQVNGKTNGRAAFKEGKPTGAKGSNNGREAGADATKENSQCRRASTPAQDEQTAKANGNNTLPAIDPPTPFYISPISRKSLYPTFSGIAQVSDFASWAQEDVTQTAGTRLLLQAWIEEDEEEDTSGSERDENKELDDNERDRGGQGRKKVRRKRWKELEGFGGVVDMRDLLELDEERADDLPENTPIFRFTAYPTRSYYLPTQTSNIGASAQTSTPQPNLRRDVRSIVERSLRETKMQKSLDLRDLGRMVEVHVRERRLAEEARGLVTAIEEMLAEQEREDELRRHVNERQTYNARLRSRIDALRDANSQTRTKLEARRQQLDERRGRLHAAGRIVLELGEENMRSQETLSAMTESTASLLPATYRHRAHLYNNLDTLFPIHPLDPQTLLYSILSVPLPIPTDPKSPAPPLTMPSSALPPGYKVDEESTATALGFVAMCLQRMGELGGRELRYPVTCYGSRSLVRDNISIIQGPRSFPLYAKGIEKYRYDYAVFLLNKNIELMMIDANIKIEDMRHTLPNLKTLLLTLASQDTPPKAQPIVSSKVDRSRSITSSPFLFPLSQRGLDSTLPTPRPSSPTLSALGSAVASMGVGGGGGGGRGLGLSGSGSGTLVGTGAGVAGAGGSGKGRVGSFGGGGSGSGLSGFSRVSS